MKVVKINLTIYFLMMLTLLGCSHIDKNSFTENLQPCSLSQSGESSNRIYKLYSSRSCYLLVAHFSKKVGVHDYSSGGISGYKEQRAVWSPITGYFETSKDINSKKLKPNFVHLAAATIHFGKKKYFSPAVDVPNQYWGIVSIDRVIKSIPISSSCRSTYDCRGFNLKEFNSEKVLALLADMRAVR